MNPQEIARYIDHTALTAEKTFKDIEKLCNEAKTHQFYSVCINSGYIPFAKQQLLDSNVKICTVVGFPLGANLSRVKAFETQEAIKAGADEIDMVVNIGWVKSAQWQDVQTDIQAVLTACGTTPLKVILETCLLTKEEIVKLCEICKTLNVAFVKTSTGFSHHGATIEDVKLMKETVGQIGVKASGGIRDLNSAKAMLEAGASRLGVSASLAIMQGFTDTTSSY